jgi:hypothetical protein
MKSAVTQASYATTIATLRHKTKAAVRLLFAALTKVTFMNINDP